MLLSATCVNIIDIRSKGLENLIEIFIQHCYNLMYFSDILKFWDKLFEAINTTLLFCTWSQTLDIHTWKYSIRHFVYHDNLTFEITKSIFPVPYFEFVNYWKTL